MAECDIYLKEGETPRQRMDRDHLDILALGKMLADDRKRRDEAEARVKALTEALDERQDSGRDFWMKWTQKRLETRNAMFLRDAKLALGGDMRALTPPDITAAAARVLIPVFEEKHRDYMLSKGRNPDDYSSHFSMAVIDLRALAEVKP